MTTEKNTDRKQYQKALMELIGCRPVAYWPYLARRVGGVKAAVMLSQLLYWHGDDTVQKRDGWVLKSVDEMESETGLTILEQQTARKNLKALGVLECELKGIPRIWYYRVNMDRLSELLIDAQPIEPETHSMGNPFNGNAIQQETHSMDSRSNIARDSRGMFTRKTGQLNNELKTTSLKTTHKTTSSSSSAHKRRGKKQEEEVTQTVKFSDEILGRFKEIGVFENLYAEIASHNLPDQVLLEMIKQAEAEDREKKPGSVAALFVYRVRNAPSGPAENLTPEEREARDRRRKYGDWEERV